MQRADFLARIELFAGVPDSLLADVAASLEEVRYPAGMVVFNQGDEGDAAYVVVDGRLSLESEGVSLLLRIPGECVGEFSLIDGEPRSTAVVARSDVTLLRWSRSDFLAALARDVAVARGIFKMLTGKLREDVETGVKLRLEQERWQYDLERASEIQMGMLPSGPLSCQGLDVVGHCAPAAQVGGDYFDYFSLDSVTGRTGVVIGDVTGHGFYSGLFVAMAKSAIHTQAPVNASPAAMMAAMRTALDMSIDRRLLMSCCYVEIDPIAGRLRYANAGHPPPLLVPASGEAMRELSAIDPILGVLDLDLQPEFGEADMPWGPGDLLVLYSDGVTEARGPDATMFGEDRLRKSLKMSTGLTARETLDRLLGEVSGFGAGQPVGDDLTVVVASATPAQANA